MSLKKILIESPEFTDEQKKRLFDQRIARVQRGKPEQIMVDTQMFMGGGVMSFAIEHTGDLTHRMTEEVTYYNVGYEAMSEKVPKILRTLTHGYGFEREFKENIKNNANYYGKSPTQFMSEVKRMLQKYAGAHKAIPYFNEMQLMARDSAIHLGELSFRGCIDNLKVLDLEIKKGVSNWKMVA